MRGPDPSAMVDRVHQTVGSVGLAPRPLGGAVPARGQPPDAPAAVNTAVNAADTAPDLAWRSSIGQIIFLQSLVSERT